MSKETKELEQKSARIRKIAATISEEWGKSPKGVYYAARPYLMALQSLTPEGTYGVEDYHGLIPRTLGAMSTFRGPIARDLKKELKKIAGIK